MSGETPRSRIRRMEKRAHQSSKPGVGDTGMGEMLSWIRRIVGFGARRPGYPQGLQVELWLEQTLREFGLAAVRREPVPLNRWESLLTSLAIRDGAAEIPCFPIPYTAWTPAAGLDLPTAFLGEGNAQDFQHADLRGRIALVEARFAELTGAALKQGAFFVEDARQTIPDGPLHVANWLIRNFSVYYDAQKRGAAAFIGLLMDSPTDGCEFYVPYDGYL